MQNTAVQLTLGASKWTTISISCDTLPFFSTSLAAAMPSHQVTNDAIRFLQTLRLPPEGEDEVKRACQAACDFVTDGKHPLNRGTYTPLCRLLLEKITPLLTSPYKSSSATLSSTNRQLVTRLFDTSFLRGIPIVAFTELTATLAKSSFHTNTGPNADSRSVVARTLVLFVARSIGGTQRLAQVIAHVDDAEVGSVNDSDVVNNLVHLPSRVLNILFSKPDTNEDDDDDDAAADQIDNSYSNNDFSDDSIEHDFKNATTSKLPLSEHEYMHTLCEALYLQPDTSDIVRERVVRALLSRIITLGYAPTLISVLISHSDVAKSQRLLKLAASSRVHSLLRALLEAPVQNSHSEQFVRSVLTYLVVHDRAARDSCIYRIPFSRPLLRSPRLSLTRLVTTVCNLSISDENNVEAVCTDALTTAVENWSDEAFALGADVSMQRQVTRLLLYYLLHSAVLVTAPRGFATLTLPSVTLDIARGVQTRLDESDIRLRRHAMVIAEAASRHARDPKPLKFDRTGLSDSRRSIQKTIGDSTANEDGDSDFSDIALSVGRPGPVIENEIDANFTSSSFALDQKEAIKTPSEATKLNGPGSSTEPECIKRQTDEVSNGRKRNLVVRHNWPCLTGSDDWQEEDDWSSVESYEQTSSEDESRSPNDYGDEEALRKKLQAPDSVWRLLAFIREMNSSDGGAVTIPPETALSALRSVKSRADTRRGTNAFRIAALDLCLDLSIFDPERFPDDTVDALKLARESALTAVLRLDIGVAGAGLVSQVICGPSADVGRRLETLSILTNAVRLEAEFVNAQGVNIVRGLRRGTQLLAEQFVHVFHTLVSSFCAEKAGSADFINVEGRDSELWARALIALAALARGAGATLEGSAMRKELLSVVLDRVAQSVRADVVVRRAMALVIGSAVDNMTENELSQVLEGSSNTAVIYVHEADVDDKNLSRLADRALEWLVAAARDDADVGVRRFAGLGLRKWATHSNIR